MKISASVLRNIPGFLSSEHRGYCYVESQDLGSFRFLFPQIRNVGATPVPREGGMLNEEAEIRLPTRESFFAVSFKGDRSGWLQLIRDYATHCGLKYAEVEGEEVVTSDGRRVRLLECDFVQH